MFNIMGTYNTGITKLYVGRQNLNSNTIKVMIEDKVVDCPIYMDKNNDIYFTYDNKEIYFKYLM